MYLTTKESEKEKMGREKRDSVIKRIKNYKSVDEVVAYLFATIGDEDITANDYVLHSAFYELKKKHPELLDELSFTSGQIFPFSADLQRAIFNLQRSELMEAPNPSYEYHVMKKKDKDVLKSDLAKVFSKQNKAELTTMARELKVSIERGASQASR